MSDESTQSAISQIEATLRKLGLVEFSGEVQLLEWSKSTSRDGPKVKFLLPADEDMGPFEAATIRKNKQAGQIYHIFAVRIDPDSALRTVAGPSAPGESEGADASARPSAPPPPANDLAKRLHVDGYFRNPLLWRALHDKGFYTVQQHKHYIESLPCLFDLGSREGRHLAPAVKRGMRADKLIECTGNVCLHHCRAAHLTAAGKALQPENPAKIAHWYGVPLCDGHHVGWIHAGAERADHRRLLEAAIGLMADQAKVACKKVMGIDSTRKVTREMLKLMEWMLDVTTPFCRNLAA